MKLQALRSDQENIRLESGLSSPGMLFFVAPALSVVLLLLGFFLFSSGFVLRSGISVALPASSSTLQPFSRAHLLTLSAGKESMIQLNEKEIEREILKEELLRARETSRQLIIQADVLTPYGLVVEVADLALSLGFEVASATTPLHHP